MRISCGCCSERVSSTGILPVGQLGVSPGRRTETAGKMPTIPTAKMAALRVARFDLPSHLANGQAL